jgi:hypothetical protein
MNRDAAAKNEELFRTVNEQIEAISEAVAVTDPTMEFLCECDRVDCHATVNATRAEYESVRAISTHFIAVPHHVDPSVEHVVFSNERFLVVEKEGEAAERAVESDPRE